MKSALVLAAVGFACVAFEAEAFAQMTPPAATAPTSDSSAPQPTTVTPADAPVIDVSRQTAPATDTTTPLDNTNAPAAKGDKAAIPQTEERPYVRSPQMTKAMTRTTTWDLNLELGYGRVFRDPAHWEGFFRGGAGLLFVRDPIFWVFRFTYEYSPRSNATLGTELEANWVETGLWANLGLMKDANSPYWGGRVSLGWALFGFEGEYRGDAQAQTYFALYGKLRLPLGVLGQVLR